MFLQVSVSMNNVAKVLRHQCRYAEAAAIYREVLVIQKRVAGTDSIPVADTLRVLGDMLFEWGKYEEALAELDLSHAIFLLLTKGRHEKFNLVIEMQNKCHAAIAKRNASSKK